MRLSWKSLFLISNSPHKLILSLRALSHIFAWRSCNLWVSSSRWDSFRAISELLCSHLLISTSASISDNFSELHSPLELMTQPSSPEFYEDFLVLLWIDRCFHLDLFCLSSTIHLLWTQIPTPAPRAPPIEKSKLVSETQSRCGFPKAVACTRTKHRQYRVSWLLAAVASGFFMRDLLWNTQWCIFLVIVRLVEDRGGIRGM